jgi:SAM-dependent methyltransferase
MHFCWDQPPMLLQNMASVKLRSRVLDAHGHIAYTCARAGKPKEPGDRDMTIAIENIPADGLEQLANTPLPPESLRQRVHGAADAASFLGVGQQCAQDIVAGLQRIGRLPDSFASVLDFGCGCGRVLRWLKPEFTSARVFGTDIDRQAVSWCSKNLPGIVWSVNAGLPPLGYAAQSFDLIYAISVFSHLDEDFQFYWLNELRRITKPGGIVLLSIHGSFYLDSLDAAMVAEIKAKGMLFVVSGGWKNIFPDWYQIALHTKEYILDTYARYFDILDYLPGGMNTAQDLVILQRRPEPEVGLDRELVLEAITSQQRSRITLLEQSIEIKNQHILRLEQLIGAIERGRVMRVLRWITRRRR